MQRHMHIAALQVVFDQQLPVTLVQRVQTADGDKLLNEFDVAVPLVDSDITPELLTQINSRLELHGLQLVSTKIEPENTEEVA